MSTKPELLTKDTTAADGDLIMKTATNGVTKTITALNFFNWLWGKIKGKTKSALDTSDATAPVNTTAINTALGSYYNKQSVDNMLNNLPQKTIVNPTSGLGDIIESSNIERIDFFGKKMYRGSITFKENTSTQTLYFSIQGVSANKRNVGTWSAGVSQQGTLCNTNNSNIWVSDDINNTRVKVSDLSGKTLYFNLFEVE